MEAGHHPYPQGSLKSLHDPDAEARVQRVIKAFGLEIVPRRPLTPPPPDRRPWDARTIGKIPTPEGDPYFQHGVRRSTQVKES